MQVPGDPQSNVTQFLPEELQPTQGDLLLAASIQHRNEKKAQRLAGDVLPFPGPSKEFMEGRRMMQEELAKPQPTKTDLTKALLTLPVPPGGAK